MSQGSSASETLGARGSAANKRQERGLQVNRSWHSLARGSVLAGALLLATTTAARAGDRSVSVVVSTPGLYTAFSTGPRHYPYYGYAPPPVYTPGYWSWTPPRVYYPQGYYGGHGRDDHRWKDDHPRHHAQHRGEKRGEKRGWDRHDRRDDDRRHGRRDDHRDSRDWRDHRD